MKKTIIGIVLALTMLFTGCNGKTSSENNKGIKIVTTLFAGYDFARAVIGDEAKIEMLLKPGNEAHTYEPTPSDIIAINECDLFIYVGGENEEWVENVLKSVDNPKMHKLAMMDVVKLFEEETIEGMQQEDHEHTHEEEKGEWDEHVWTSPKNAIEICNKIKEKITLIAPEKKDAVETKTKAYTDRLLKIDGEFREICENTVNKTIVFGDRFPLRYFTEEYGLKYYAAFPGCAESAEVSAGTLAFLIDKVKNENIKTVFKIELSNGNIAEKISEETGAKVETFYSCHNVTKEDFDKGLTYADFMERNVKTLKEALN